MNLNMLSQNSFLHVANLQPTTIRALLAHVVHGCIE